MIEGLIGQMARERDLPLTRRMQRRARWVAKRLPPSQPVDVRLIGELYEAVEYGGRCRRKSSGSFYTPRSVVRVIVQRVVTRPLAGKLGRLRDPEAVRKAALSFRVCDPAMGTGFFLLESFRAIVETVQRRLSQLGHEPVDLEQLERDVVTRCLHGTDIDARAVAIARSLLWIEGGVRPGRGIAVVDALGQTAGDADFDAVVGNPPYGGRLSAEATDNVGDWVTARGGYRNTALHFLELSASLAGDGGWVGLILPKSLAYSRGWWSGARLVLPWLREIVDASLAFEDVRLEQIIVVFRKCSDRRQGGYSTGRLVRGRIEGTGKVDRGVASDAGCLLVGVSDGDLELYRNVWKRCRPLSDLAVSFRGLGIQGRVRADGDVEGVDGRNIERWGIKRPLRRFSGEGLTGRRVERLNVGMKIISQNIVAHVRKPRPRIVMMSTMDTEGLLTLDTVTNTVIVDETIDPWFVLGLLNSEFISWWAHKFIFCGAVRTMHLDAGYVGRLPIGWDARLVEQIGSMARSPAARQDGLDVLVCRLYGVVPRGDGYATR